MSKDNDDLRQLIEAGFAQLNHRLGAMESRLGAMESRLGAVEARLERMEMAQAEMRGEMRGLAAWLSSMDQRFVAIMRPYEPPHRPAE